MPRTFFVTGTDTGVGKTLAAASLLCAASNRGLRTIGLKPVAAGCDAQGHNEDALLLKAATTETLTYEQVNPVALEAAIAPHIAAAEEGRTLRASQLAGYCRGAMLRGVDLTLIEGAGGWRVPLSNRETLADLARELQTQVLLVVAMRLGCINHAILTAEAVVRDGLRLAGWIANSPGETMDRYAENLDTLRTWMPGPLLGELPRMDEPDPQVGARHLDLDGILE